MIGSFDSTSAAAGAAATAAKSMVPAKSSALGFPVN
jgi:hypothetical protein